MARGFRGVKDDLSEIGRHLLDVACFLAPLIAASASYADSPPSSPHGANPNPNSSNQSQEQQQEVRLVAGALNDFAEFGAGLRSGIARVSGVLKRRNSGGMREELLRFVRDLVRCPESWLEFPVPVDDHFDMSRHQRDHIATVERLAPSFATLRISLCPNFMTEESFWKIYFALLHPKLNKLESEFLSTQQIVEEMRLNLKKKMQSRVNFESQNPVAETSSSIVNERNIETQHDTIERDLQNRDDPESKSVKISEDPSSITSDTIIEANQSQVRAASTEAKPLEYINRWLDSPAIIREREQVSTKEDDSYSETEDDDNIILRKKNRISPSLESLDEGYSLVSSKEKLQARRKLGSSDDSEKSDWHAGEDSSDFEMVERS